MLQRTGVYYYFEVGEAMPGQPARYVGADGKLIAMNSNPFALRTFASLAESHKFFELMNGRYAGVPLVLRSYAPDLKVARTRSA